MDQTTRTFRAAALGGVLLAILAVMPRPGAVSGAPNDPTTPSHTITVTAAGAVTLVPDVARVNLGVTLTKGSVKAARDAAAVAMQGVISAVKGLGIADADIQTTNLSLYPQYANNSTKIVGYQVSNQVVVTIRDIDKAGDVVDAATTRGATDVNGISFEVGDAAKALDDARAAAIRAARASATAMAAAAGVTLGSVVSMTDATAPTPVYMKAMRVAADAATPVEAGSQDVSASVTVVFEID